MAIKIINYFDRDCLNISLPLVVGEVVSTGDDKILVQNVTSKSEPVIWPVVSGKFKVLVQLRNGENSIKFQYRNYSHHLTLTYKPLQYKRFVRMVYIKCFDDKGTFQAPQGENNSIQSACKRLSLAGKMLQTFTSDKIKEHGLKGKTFRLEEENGEVVCHVFTSSLPLEEAYKLNEEQLWSHFAVELMNSSLRVGNDCKFLAFLSFTRYANDLNVPPVNHQQILRMTKGQVALGGGGLALFGTGCLHTWPENLQEVPWRFGDKRKIDRTMLMDDSANRGWYWACYSTGLGSTLHELGHTFDLGHTSGGIMGRGFDDIHKYFIVDMFYHDHLFQKLHNPFYQVSSTHSHTVPLCMTSPISWGPNLNTSLQNLQLENVQKNCGSEKQRSYDSKNEIESIERPWRIPNPPDGYSEDKFAVHVGGAYWTRSSALILYFHKWFNDAGTPGSGSISVDDAKLSSPCGIRVIEFRDNEGTSFHHLEFLEEDGETLVDLTKLGMFPNLPTEISRISFIAEDSIGNVIKSKLNIEQILSQKAEKLNTVV